MIEVEMARTAKMAVEQVLNLKAGENVLIVTDTGRPTSIARALAAAVHAAGAEAVVATMTTRRTHGADPPRIIAEAMKAADAVMQPTTFALTHTDAVRNALKKGTRSSTALLPAYSPDSGWASRARSGNNRLRKGLTKSSVTRPPPA